VLLMRPFTRHEGRLVPLDRANVDTDQIIPKQFCKRVERTGFGPCLFYDWRRADPDFVLDRPRYRGASILVAGDNFGCGSSREHAVWAIEDAGYRVVVAPSFGDIFRNNCHKIGVLPVVLDEAGVRRLMDVAAGDPAAVVTVDLPSQSIAGPGFQYAFDIPPFVKECLLNGWDDIGLTMRHQSHIARYEARLPAWIVPVETGAAAASGSRR
jgi:3-isopropylmalate/(R)-2-methylmalate dehydratase small subunit